MKPSDYTDRDIYRNRVVSDLACWRTQYLETELFICARKPLEAEAQNAVIDLRRVLDSYIAKYPVFKTTLSPIEPQPGAHPVIARMCEAGKAANVGPMAAVAGAFATYVVDELLKFTDKAIVENGGDIYMMTGDIRTVAVYAGNSPLSMKIGVKADSREMPISVCTSSGTVGPSLSFGHADAAVIVARDAYLADACATRLGNELKTADDIQSALETVYAIEGVMGAVAVVEDKCGAIGDIELVSL
jgi:ApbE superfamily uncharacterized protein (UPF0280 family)